MNFITSVAAWVCVPIVIVYFTLRALVFGIIEFFVPNKNTKTVPNTMHNTISGAPVADATTKVKPMSDERFHQINNYLHAGFESGVSPQSLAMRMMIELKVTSEEAEQMRVRLLKEEEEKNV